MQNKKGGYKMEAIRNLIDNMNGYQYLSLLDLCTYTRYQIDVSEHNFFISSL